MFTNARQAEIIRSNQKDDFYSSYIKTSLAEIVQDCFGKWCCAMYIIACMYVPIIKERDSQWICSHHNCVIVSSAAIYYSKPN